MKSYSLILLAIIPLLLISIIPIQAQQDEGIPIWMKIVFEAWLDDDIAEIEVLNAIKYLVETDIILIENTKTMSETEPDPFGRTEIDSRTNEQKLKDLGTYFDEQLEEQKTMYEEKIKKILDDHDIKIEEDKQKHQEELDKKDLQIERLKN